MKSSNPDFDKKGLEGILYFSVEDKDTNITCQAIMFTFNHRRSLSGLYLKVLYGANKYSKFEFG